MTYSFTLILAGSPTVNRALEDGLFEAGCDDALLGSRNGVTFLDFDREAASLEEAIDSAILDVESVGQKVKRIEPDDFVNVAEIARRTGHSRECIRLYVLGRRGPGGFPPPTSGIKRTSPLWRWSDVAEWFSKRQPDCPAYQDALAIKKTNAYLEFRQCFPEVGLVDDVRRAVPRQRNVPRRRAAAKR
jgi:hypothetical protein